MRAPCRPASMPRQCAEHTRRGSGVGAALLLACAGVAAEPQGRLFDVWLNGVPVQANALVMEEGGALYAPASALGAWRLKPDDAPRHWEGAAHHSLQAWSPRVDAGTQRLLLWAPAEAFAPQVLHLSRPAQGADEGGWAESFGLALDHALRLDHERGSTQGSALLDLRVFGLVPQASLRHSGLLQVGPLDTQGTKRWRRLDTVWRHANPRTMWRTTVGDTLGCGGDLAPTVRQAGVQLHTDFGLQPDQAPYPVPAVQGSAQVPSGIELLVNDQPAGTVDVGPGPFTLQTLPTLNGAGEIQLVQRDVQGNEQVRTVPYYNSPRLLRDGLTEHCLEAGWLRRDYGLATDRYQDRIAAASWRRGWGSTFTTSARAVAGDAVQSLHLGMHWVPAHLGVVTLQLGRSQADGAGSGHSLRLGVERVAPGYHFSANLERAQDSFRQTDGLRAPQHRAALFGGRTFGAFSWSAGGVWQRNARGVPLRVLTTSVQRRLGPHWQMGLSALQRNGRWQAALLLTRPLDSATVLAVRAQAGGEGGLAVQAQRNEPLEGGAGWRAQAGAGEQNSAAAAWSWLGDAGRLELQAAGGSTRRDTAMRATLQGSLIWLGGLPVLARSLGDGAVARVEVPGMPGVRVQLNRREVATTDANGRAWVFGLQPWEDNLIGVATEDLPMDALLGFADLRLRPPDNAVVRARFDSRRSRSAVVVVRFADGQPVAAGSRARPASALRQTGAPFALGGRVYLHDLQDQNRIRIDGPQGVCFLAFAAPPDTELQPQLGPFTCSLEGAS